MYSFNFHALKILFQETKRDTVDTIAKLTFYRSLLSFDSSKKCHFIYMPYCQNLRVC